MVQCIALFVIAVDQNSFRSQEGSYMSNLVHYAVSQSIQALKSEEKLVRRLDLTIEAAELLGTIDDHGAMAAIAQTWDLSQEMMKTEGLSQSRLIEGVAVIDPKRGSAPALKPKAEYLRTREAGLHSQELIVRHPGLAAKNLAGASDIEVMENVLRLCRIRIDMGVKFLKMLHRRTLEIRPD